MLYYYKLSYFYNIIILYKPTYLIALLHGIGIPANVL